MERPLCDVCKEKGGLLVCYDILMCGTCYMKLYNKQGDIIKQLLQDGNKNMPEMSK